MKIFITGPCGGGKTTFGRKLSNKLSIPFYSLDDIMFDSTRSTRFSLRPEKERDNMLKDMVLSTDDWIVEGAYLNWVMKCIREADIVYIVRPSMFVNICQLIKRFYINRVHFSSPLFKPIIQKNINVFLSMFTWRKGTNVALCSFLQDIGKEPIILKNRRETSKILNE